MTTLREAMELAGRATIDTLASLADSGRSWRRTDADHRLDENQVSALDDAIEVLDWLRSDEARAMLAVWEAWGDAATGEVFEIGDDDEGQPRVLIHSTRNELRKAAQSICFKRVRLVPESLLPVGGGEG